MPLYWLSRHHGGPAVRNSLFFSPRDNWSEPSDALDLLVFWARFTLEMAFRNRFSMSGRLRPGSENDNPRPNGQSVSLT